MFELPNKIGLTQEHYFVVQSIYRGWALFGIVIFAAIAANFLVALEGWRRGKWYWPPLVAGLILRVRLVFFCGWPYPANQATANWTKATADWERIRTQWEVSHAVNAALTFI